MRALTDVLPGADEALPLLILDQRPYMTVRSGAAEGRDLFCLRPAEHGPNPGNHDPDQRTARPGPGVAARLSARRAARLTAPDRSIIWGGECGQPRPWRALITRTNRCAVLIGATGLWTGPGERPSTRIETLLDRAAYAEELVGDLVEACC